MAVQLGALLELSWKNSVSFGHAHLQEGRTGNKSGQHIHTLRKSTVISQTTGSGKVSPTFPVKQTLPKHNAVLVISTDCSLFCLGKRGIKYHDFKLTVSNVVDAVKVLSSILIIHILPFGLDDLHRIVSEEQLAGRAVASEGNIKLNSSGINSTGNICSSVS